MEDSGSYQCVVVNFNGTDESDVAVIVVLGECQCMSTAECTLP